MLNDLQLKQIFPLLSAAQRNLYLPFLNLSMARFNINTEKRVAMYLAQLEHESQGLTKWVENLKYSARRLTEVWHKRFPTIAAAAPFANNPQALANKVYNGRMGNRIGTDDGWNFRGRFPIQATGREMYIKLNRELGEELGVDFVLAPNQTLDNPLVGFMASAFIFAVEKGCLPLADKNDITSCTKAINGGLIGLAERRSNWKHNLAILPDDFKLESYPEMRPKLEKSLEKVAPLVSEHSPVEIHNDEVLPPVDQGEETEFTEGDNAGAPVIENPVIEPIEGATLNADTINIVGSKTNSTAPPLVNNTTTANVTKERPSTFVKIGACFTAIAGFGINLANVVQTKLEEMQAVHIAFLVLGIGLIALAIYVYDRSAERSNKLNLAKLDSAKSTTENQVEFVDKK